MDRTKGGGSLLFLSLSLSLSLSRVRWERRVSRRETRFTPLSPRNTRRFSHSFSRRAIGYDVEIPRRRFHVRDQNFLSGEALRCMSVHAPIEPGAEKWVVAVKTSSGRVIDYRATFVTARVGFVSFLCCSLLVERYRWIIFRTIERSEGKMYFFNCEKMDDTSTPNSLKIVGRSKLRRCLAYQESYDSFSLILTWSYFQLTLRFFFVMIANFDRAVCISLNWIGLFTPMG